MGGFALAGVTLEREAGALHTRAEALGHSCARTCLGLASDRSTEGVGHTEVEGECTILVVGIHLIVGSRDIQTEILRRRLYASKSKAKLPLEERVG